MRILHLQPRHNSSEVREAAEDIFGKMYRNTKYTFNLSAEGRLEENGHALLSIPLARKAFSDASGKLRPIELRDAILDDVLILAAQQNCAIIRQPVDDKLHLIILR